MSEERFANLETIISFHEDTIQKLNEVVYKQQLKIDQLEEKLDALTQLIQAPGESAEAEREPKP